MDYGKYFDTRFLGGAWVIVGSVDGAHWYGLYEHLFRFSSQAEARAWLITEGYTSAEINRWIAKNAVLRQIAQTWEKEQSA